MEQITSQHVPVLLQETISVLRPQPGESYLDLTAGRAGHAQSVLGITANTSGAVLVDRDLDAISALSSNASLRGAAILHNDFLSACVQLVASEQKFDMILADFGVSSPHLDIASRGFSLKSEGPLDMRMDQSRGIDAATIVNTWTVEQLTDILRAFGEEPKARQIARLITEHRPFQTTTQLASIVSRAYPGHSKKHPATKTFQALRVAVNDELAQISATLPIALQLLKPGGRLAIITFHSLEDRIVKQCFQEYAADTYDSHFRQLTKKPITAEQNELVLNPRARSAKLRAVEKIKTKNQ